MFKKSMAVFCFTLIALLSLGCGGSRQAPPGSADGGNNNAQSKIHWRSMEGYDSQGGK